MLRFTLLTFAISWVLWGLIAMTGLSIQENLTAGLAYVLGGFGPAIAGIILSRRDPNLYSDFWPRLVEVRRVQPAWWILILLIYPATVLVAYAVAWGVWPDAVGGPVLQDEVIGSPALFVLTLLYIAIVGPISEEPGWRGYALEKLQRRYAPLSASLILGVVWWMWHLPLMVVPGSFLFTSGRSLPFLAGYLGTVLLYSILFTWIYNHNRRSVLAAIAIHFSINLTAGVLAPPFEVFMVTTFLLILVVIGVVVQSTMWRRIVLTGIVAIGMSVSEPVYAQEEDRIGRVGAGELGAWASAFSVL